MTPAKIRKRETDDYALMQPTMLRVSIKDGVVHDNLEVVYPHITVERLAPRRGWENVHLRTADRREPILDTVRS